MENELVKEFLNDCAEFDDELRGFYDDVKERGAEEEDIDYLIGLMYNLNSLRGTDERTLPTSRIILEDIKKRFKTRKDIINSYLYEREEELRKLQEDDEEFDTVVYPAKESTKCKAWKVVASVLGVSFLGGLCVHTGLLLNNCHNKNADEEIVEETDLSKDTKTSAAVNKAKKETKKETEKSTEVETEKQTETKKETEKETETKKETEEVKKLAPGEYGTFLDASDEAQVQARAQYLFDNYYSPNMKYIDEGDRHLVTVENIANTIRVMNGELPLDEEGNQFKDGATVDDYTSVLLAMTVNAGSTVGEEYYHFPAYLLAEDKSELSEFIKSYDVIYDKLVYSMNVEDNEQAKDAIACLGYKFWNEWYLQGMYGDTNPHTLDADLRYLAFVATIEPYNTTALEYHLNQQEPVCIEACIDYETKEKELLSVDAIKVALETGEWNQVSAKLAGMDVPNEPWLPLFWEELDGQLNWKYDHRQSMKLN